MSNGSCRHRADERISKRSGGTACSGYRENMRLTSWYDGHELHESDRSRDATTTIRATTAMARTRTNRDTALLT